MTRKVRGLELLAWKATGLDLEVCVVMAGRAQACAGAMAKLDLVVKWRLASLTSVLISQAELILLVEQCPAELIVLVKQRLAEQSFVLREDSDLLLAAAGER